MISLHRRHPRVRQHGTAAWVVRARHRQVRGQPEDGTVAHKGVARRVWTKALGARNEPLDCRILAMAALEGLKAPGLRLARLSGLNDKPARRRSMGEWAAVFNG